MERSSRARILARNIAAVVCAAIVLGGGCEARDIDFFGLSGSPDGKYHVLYAPKETGKAFRFFLVAGEAEFADPGRALFSAELAEKSASSFLWTGSALNAPVAFDPDNKHLAYVSESTGNYEIHELDLATMQTRILAPHPAKDDSPSYSPDGKYLAFISYRSGKGEIWLWDRAANELKQLTHDPADLVLVRFISAKKLLFAQADDENARIFDLDRDQSSPLPGGARELSFDSRQGLIVSAKLSAEGDEYKRILVSDVEKGTNRELDFHGELESFSVPLSPDGKWAVAASKEAVEVLPVEGGSALTFALPGALKKTAPGFLAWMPDGKRFRLLAGNAQFTADLADPARSLTPRDKYALSLSALDARARDQDGDFAAKASGLDAMPDPLKHNDGQKKTIGLTRVIAAYAAGQYEQASTLWKDSLDPEERELSLYIGLMDKTPEDFRAGRTAFLALPDDQPAVAEAKTLVKKTDFVDGLDGRQLKAMMKYLKPLIAERLDVMACDLNGDRGRKLSPETKKIVSYLNLHPGSPLAGYLALTLAEVAESYRQPVEAEKYYRLAAKTPEDRLESLVRLASLYGNEEGKKDPLAELQVNETIMAEFPGTNEANHARESAGQSWISRGDDEKAFELLAPLALDSDSAAAWRESRQNSEPMFKALVLARFAPGLKQTLEYLARAVDQAPANKPDQILLGLSDKTFNDLGGEHLSHKTTLEPTKREKILVYRILNGPAAADHVLVYYYYFLLRQEEVGADIEPRWDGYAQAHPELAKSYPFLLLMGLLDYDRHNYAAARAQFEQALAALGNQPDQAAEAKDLTRQLILICLARETDKLLLQKLSATIKEDPRKEPDVYGHTLAANLTGRPLPEISEFYLASRALGEDHADAYELLECRASDDDRKKVGQDFVAKYPQSPLTAAVLFALEDYDAVIARFPDSFAAYAAMRIKADNYDGNANYWLAAGMREKLLDHPQLRKEDKAELLWGLGEYELEHTRDYKQARELLARAARENPQGNTRQGIMLDQARTWYQLKDLAQARQALDRFTREYPDARTDQIDELKRALGAP
jgi:hypothetical protein